MELSTTITKEDYYQDKIQTHIREVFEPNSYIISKPQNNGFADIKTKITEIINNIISPNELSFDEKLNEKFLELDFGSEFNIDATKIGINDAIFFINLLNKEGCVNYNVENNVMISIKYATNIFWHKKTNKIRFW